MLFFPAPSERTTIQTHQSSLGLAASGSAVFSLLFALLVHDTITIFHSSAVQGRRLAQSPGGALHFRRVMIQFVRPGSPVTVLSLTPSSCIMRFSFSLNKMAHNNKCVYGGRLE